MPRVIKWLLIGLVVAAVPAAGWLTWHALPEQQAFYTDANTIRQPCAAGPPRDILWQPPVSLGEILNTSEQDYEPRLSWDGLTLYFVRGRAGENADIFVATRIPTGWTAPQPLAEINSAHDELGPEPAPDGTALYFYSDRPGGCGGYDLWVARRGEVGWLPPTNLGPAVNSEFNDYGPAVAPDAATLYFSSNRPRPDGDVEQQTPSAWPATVREDLARRMYDLYRAALTDAGPRPAEPLARLNTPHNEGAPCVSPAGDFLYFASDRPGGEGGFDLYRTRVLPGEFEAPRNLGAPVNGPSNELDPGLTHLGYALYFSSDREDAPEAGAQRGDYNLYFTSAREVFRQVEAHARPPINWAALWTRVGPLLLWLLAALLLVVLAAVLAGRVRDGRLSLLARCLLASLTAHALLMLALSFWGVSAALSDVLRHGGTRVSLSTPSQAGDLTAQIRGQFTAFDAPAAEPCELKHAALPVQTHTPQTLVTLNMRRSTADLREQPLHTAAAAAAPEPAEMQMPTHAPQPSNTPLVLRDIAVPSETARSAATESELAVRPAPPQAAASEHFTLVGDVTTQTRMVPASVEPRRATAMPAESSLVAAQEPTRQDARVDDVPSINVPQPLVPVTAPPDPLVALPTMEEAASHAVNEPAQEPTPQVAAVRTDATRPQLVAELPATPSLRLAEVRPTSPVELPAEAAWPTASGVTGTEAAPSPLPSSTTPPTGVPVARSEPLSLGLRLPDEVEAPPPPALGADDDRSNDQPPVGTIAGRVTDRATGEPLVNAAVHLELPDAAALNATTDADGQYLLPVPSLPDFVALSATCPGYVPGSASIPGRRVVRSSVTQDFELDAVSPDVIALEPVPQVHHLGNDRFEGRINSQFQKRAEGRALRGYLQLSDEQVLPRIRAVSLSLLAKGVQCPHKILVNGHLLDERLDHSPADGSFGEFTISFDPELLKAGANMLEIRGVRCQGDVDDFEIVNIQVRLVPAADTDTDTD